MPPSNKVEIIVSAKNITGKAMTQVQKYLDAVKKRVFSLQGAVAALAGGYGLKKLAGAALDVAASFEQMESKLNALTKGRGRETLEELNAWALEMPVNTRKAVDSFTMMTAMGLEPTIEKMQILVDTASIFGEESMPRIARALGQMQTLGKLSAEELNQLSEAGINARKYITEAFGKTVEELQKSNIAIERIISVIWKGLATDFGGAAKAAQNSWRGLKATFISYSEEIGRQVMAAGVFEELKTQLRSINEELKTWIENNSELIKQKVPEYIEKTKKALQGIWDVISYDPDIIKYGIIGLAFHGRKLGAFLGGAAHMANWAENLGKALGMASAGVISFKEIAVSNFKELEELVKKGEKLIEIPSGEEIKDEKDKPTRVPPPDYSQVETAIEAIRKKVEAADLKFDAQGQRHIDQAIKRIRERVKAEEEAAEAISTARAEAYQEWYDEQIAAREALKDTSQTFGEDLKNAVTGWASTWSQSLNDMVWGAEMSFGKILESFGRMITQMIIQKGVVEPILSKVGTVAMSFASSAGGGAQHGAIVSVMGEHRPEAIMPLARTPTGDLGIKTSGEGGGGGNIFNINIAAVDARSFAELTQRNPQAITGPVVEALRAGGQFRSSLRSAIL